MPFENFYPFVVKKTYMKLNTLIFLLSFAFVSSTFAQGISLNSEKAMPSYTLISKAVFGYGDTYLIDNCGKIINQWASGSNLPHVKLLKSGNIIYFDNNIIYERDWEDNLVHMVEVVDPVRLIYEVIVLPNGNYLCVGRREFSVQEFEDIGYEFNNSSPTEIDVVVEISPSTGGIVWEWNMKDHVIQERDPNMPNYGILKDNPQLVNLDAISTFDWAGQESFMINSFDYNPDLDHIALSVRKMGEVMIIDHSTTTQEAASSTGGNSGKGGDILYRWGNPMNYDSGTENDQQLFYQHNPNWVTSGPDKGKLVIYSNGLNRTGTSERYSNVPVIETTWDGSQYVKVEGEAFGPEMPEINIGPDSNTDFYSSYTSGARMLENGNIFVTEGVEGYLFEVDVNTGERVWEYQVPNVSFIYRTEKYPIDYPAFEGKDMTATDQTIEEPSSTYDCMLISSNNKIELEEVNIQFDFEASIIRSENPTAKMLEYNLVNLQGQPVWNTSTKQTSFHKELSHLVSGFYVLQIREKGQIGVQVHKIILQ